MNQTQREDLDERILTLYLERKLDPLTRESVTAMLEADRRCWEQWQRFRWNRAKKSADYAELQAYFGNEFVEYFDSSWALAEEWTSRDPSNKAEIERFYQEVPHYVYNLAIWEASGQRPPYVAQGLRYLEKYSVRYILDFGCGIGTDGLKLLKYGYQVIFYDFDNPSTQFLRWRLANRGSTAPVLHPPCTMATLPAFEVFWAMDVLEHLPDPEQTLDPFLQTARVFIFDAADTGRAGGRHPFHLNSPDDYLGDLLTTYGFAPDPSAQELTVWHRR